MNTKILSFVLILLCASFFSVNVKAAIPMSNQEMVQTVTTQAPVENQVVEKNVQKEKGVKSKLVKKMQQKANDNLILAVILAILLPPVGVAVWESGITKHFWISLILTLLFYLPGLIYSLWVILGNKSN